MREYWLWGSAVWKRVCLGICTNMRHVHFSTVGPLVVTLTVRLWQNVVSSSAPLRDISCASEKSVHATLYMWPHVQV